MGQTYILLNSSLLVDCVHILRMNSTVALLNQNFKIKPRAGSATSSSSSLFLSTL